jgi:hypothetical protein
MVAGSYTVVTVLDEVRLALAMKGSDAFLSDDEIERFIYANLESTSRSTHNFTLVTAATTGPSGVYVCTVGRPYGLMLFAPTMTAEDDCVYVLNARGSITVTSGTPTAKTITVTGIPVDFSGLMVQLLHWLATHRAQEMSVSIGDGSVSAQSIHAQLIEMAEYWTGIVTLA